MLEPVGGEVDEKLQQDHGGREKRRPGEDRDHSCRGESQEHDRKHEYETRVRPEEEHKDPASLVLATPDEVLDEGDSVADEETATAGRTITLSERIA